MNGRRGSGRDLGVCLEELERVAEAAERLGLDAGPARATLAEARTRLGFPGTAFVCALGMSLVSILAMWIAAPRHVRVLPGPIAPGRAHNAIPGQHERAAGSFASAYERHPIQ